MNYWLKGGSRIVIRTGRASHAGPYKISILPSWFAGKRNYDEGHAIKIAFKEIEVNYELAHNKR